MTRSTATLGADVAKQIEQLGDALGNPQNPWTQARAAVSLGRSLRVLARAAREHRDEAIRQIRQDSPILTVDAIAAALGVKRNIVVDALRGTRGGDDEDAEHEGAAL